jgi:hypothetical protein
MENPSQPNCVRTPRNADTKLYFAGLESFAREAKESADPRVTWLALALIQHQGATVNRLLGSRRLPYPGREALNGLPERAWGRK